MEKETKSYPVPWQGRLVLACRKCQRKLKDEHGPKALGNLKKGVKARNKQLRQKLLHVINVPCMDVCPKHSVAVCLLGKPGDRLHILRTEEDLDSFYPFNDGDARLTSQ
jgi:predicted metal-binding protein